MVTLKIMPEEYYVGLHVDYYENMLGLFTTSDAIVYGNDDFKEYIPECLEKWWKDVMSGEFQAELEDCADVKDLMDYYFNGDGTESFRGKSGNGFTDAEGDRLYEATNGFTSRGSETSLCELLSIITGGRWEHYTLRGVCQSDWQDFYCDKRLWPFERVKEFENAYFNMGYEVEILDDGQDEALEYFAIDSEEELAESYHNARILKPIGVVRTPIYMTLQDFEGVSVNE